MMILNKSNEENTSNPGNMRITYAEGTDLTTPIINLTNGKKSQTHISSSRIKDLENILAREGEERSSKAEDFKRTLSKIPRSRLILNKGNFLFDIICFNADFTDYMLTSVPFTIIDRTVIHDLNYVGLPIDGEGTPSKVLGHGLIKQLPKEWNAHRILDIQSVR